MSCLMKLGKLFKANTKWYILLLETTYLFCSTSRGLFVSFIQIIKSQPDQFFIMSLYFSLLFHRWTSVCYIHRYSGIEYTYHYHSVWNVVNCVIKCLELNIKFPTHAKQAKIVSTFKKHSSATFYKCI